MSGGAGVPTAWPIHASVRSESSVCIQQSDSEGDRKDRCASIVLTFIVVELLNCEVLGYIVLGPKPPRDPPKKILWKGGSSENFEGAM